MKQVNVTKAARLVKHPDCSGTFVVMADTKNVEVRLTIHTIPESPETIYIVLPWGKIYGLAKKAQGGD